MKKNILFGAVLLMAGSLLAADSTPKDDVTAAAKKLADTSYSWKQTLDLGPNSQFTPGPTEGKTEKDGYIWLSSSFQDNTSIGLSKGKKVAVKTDEGWKTAEELGDGGGGFDPNTFMARRMQNLKTPADEIQDIVSKTGELKKDGDVISGDLTKEGAESMLTFGFGRRGGNRPPPKDAKGSVKIWLKDGAISKYETKVSGKVDRQGEEMDIERTTTIDIKDVGNTKIEVPDDAKKKLS
ncbi:MAG TPA: hypothetical protein VHC44_17555 [Verrucomicrobiae bacterium]|nr:hypothetical protein [Verrucomicrobiae bacterium]